VGVVVAICFSASRDSRAPPDRAGDPGLHRHDLDARVGGLEDRGDELALLARLGQLAPDD